MTASGTNKTKFMRGEYGPFRCDNCPYWRAPVGCTHPEVVADPEVPKIQAPNGMTLAQAYADDCCEHFEPQRSRITDVKFSDLGL